MSIALEHTEDKLEFRKPKTAEGIVISPYGDENQSEQRYVVKDESDTYYLMTGKMGVMILSLLNGQLTVEQLSNQLQERFKNKYSIEKILNFISLCSDNRLIEEGTWPVEQKAKSKENKRERLGVYSSVINADPLLDGLMDYKFLWLNPLTKAAFFLLFCMGIISVFYIPEGGGLLSPIKQMQFSYQDVFLLLLPLIYLVELSIHELAHALACRAGGAKTQGFGFGLLWGILPVLFTETTDSYMIRNKYKRMFVSFAGPMVDVAFFGLSMSLYFLLDDGIVKTVALAYSGLSLSAFIISLNPFVIRMDGYWILADWLEKPNLRRDASRYVKDEVRRFFGRSTVNHHALNQELSSDVNIKLKYIAYSIISFVWTGAYISIIFFELFFYLFDLFAKLTANPLGTI